MELLNLIKLDSWEWRAQILKKEKVGVILSRLKEVLASLWELFDSDVGFAFKLTFFYFFYLILKQTIAKTITKKCLKVHLMQQMNISKN